MHKIEFRPTKKPGNKECHVETEKTEQNEEKRKLETEDTLISYI